MKNTTVNNTNGTITNLLDTKSNNRVSILNKSIEDNKLEIKALKATNTTSIKEILNIFLKELKEISKDTAYITFNKKAKLSIISIKVNNDLGTDVKKVIKAVHVYLLSNSSLDFNSLSIAKFILGMNVINNKDNSITKYKSNKQLEDTLKNISDSKIVIKANKILEAK